MEQAERAVLKEKKTVKRVKLGEQVVCFRLFEAVVHADGLSRVQRDGSHWAPGWTRERVFQTLPVENSDVGHGDFAAVCGVPLSCTRIITSRKARVLSANCQLHISKLKLYELKKTGL